MKDKVPEWYRIALQVGTWKHVHLVLQQRAREQFDECCKKQKDHNFNR